jgi:hypothetical protein
MPEKRRDTAASMRYRSGDGRPGRPIVATHAPAESARIVVHRYAIGQEGPQQRTEEVVEADGCLPVCGSRPLALHQRDDIDGMPAPSQSCMAGNARTSWMRVTNAARATAALPRPTSVSARPGLRDHRRCIRPCRHRGASARIRTTYPIDEGGKAAGPCAPAAGGPSQRVDGAVDRRHRSMIFR